MNNTFIVESDYLAHHGVLGMKWGIRRYQPYPKGSGKSGKEIGKAAKVQQRSSTGVKGYFEAKKKQKAAEAAKQQRVTNLQKAREAAAKKRQHEADKERVLKSGSAEEVLKYKGELSNKELQDAFTRINLEHNLARIMKEDTPVVKDGWQKMDEAMKRVGTMTDWAQKGVNAYNLMAKVYNATEEGQKKPLKTI